MISSTSFVYIMCIVISFLASQTTAQLGNWDILFQSLETDFQDPAADKIILKYQIGSGRNFIVDLMEKNCAVAISRNVVAPTTSVSHSTGVTANHDEVEIKLILDESRVPTLLNICDDNSLQFCVRIRILSGGSIIKEDFTINFTEVTNASAHISSIAIRKVLGAAACIIFAFF